ncbi:MAG: hypothetical protein KIPDCIKN_00634 [Haliscomenobacter sp.]|nr:hypothetical protein [Haliscomenobacter sp.]
MILDGICSQSTRIVLEDYASVIIAPLACHSIKFAPNFNQTSIGFCPLEVIRKMMLDGICSRSTRIVLKDYTIVIAPSACHSIKFAPNFNQTSIGFCPRSAVKMMLDGICSQSIRVILKDYTSASIAPSYCHSI